VAKTLGQVLAEARNAKGLSLRDVERATGLNNGHLSQIEKGNITKPAAGILWQLANAYRVDFSYLMQLAEKAGPQGKRTASRSLVGTALHTVGDLTPGEEKELLRFMEELRQRRTKPRE
jgi:transcriptional regulator with XRE-family HTH domain